MQTERFALRTEFIRLDQLLKAVGLCGTGGEAKIRIQEGEVAVDGEPETRRGRKIRAGQSVRMGEVEIQVTAP